MGIEAYQRDALMDHFCNPRNQGGLERAEAVGRGSNPLCGDEVEVGVRLKDGHLEEVMFRARACAICTASASLMTEALQGHGPAEAADVQSALQAWLEGDSAPPPRPLEALDPMRGAGARKRR